MPLHQSNLVNVGAQNSCLCYSILRYYTSSGCIILLHWLLLENTHHYNQFSEETLSETVRAKEQVGIKR